MIRVYSAAGREHAAVCRRSLPALAKYVNVIVAGKQPALDYLSVDDADHPLHPRARHLGVGLNDEGGEPDVVMACCGDIPTLETLAAVALLREHLPELKVRVVNVVDLMRLQPDTEHPHGMSDASSTRCSRTRSRSSSPTTATHG